MKDAKKLAATLKELMRVCQIHGIFDFTVSLQFMTACASVMLTAKSADHLHSYLTKILCVDIMLCRVGIQNLIIALIAIFGKY